MPFSSLSLSPALIAALPKNIQQPTEIQALVIPKILKNKDVLGLAQTGSGKTFAYALPIIEHLYIEQSKKASKQQALVLVPTRELAIQVSEAINQVAKKLGLKTLCLTGGLDKALQQQDLVNQPNILVATTGRLVDLIKDGLVLKQVTTLVLDEADRLLDMGFWNDVQAIAALTGSKRQTLMFSATFSDELKQKANALMYSPIELVPEQKKSINQDISEALYLVNKGSKAKALAWLFKQNAWQQALVFIGAKENADSLAKKLNKEGITACALHGDKSQAEREELLARFKSGNTELLIATDLLARGIHIDQLPVVVNFELPMHAETYVHRVGRTARAGEQGMAISLVCHGEMDALNAIRALTQRPLVLEELADFPVTDKPSTGESKRAPRDKKANRRTNSKKSIAQFQGKGAARGK